MSECDLQLLGNYKAIKFIREYKYIRVKQL